MQILPRIIASRAFAWVALATPGIVLLIIPASQGALGTGPLKELLHRSGEIAVWVLRTVLYLSPLKTLFPRSNIVSALNRHRRSVGVTAFTYALLHVNLYFIAFASHVRSLARSHENIKIHIAYSRPNAEDILGKDYDSRGRIGIETIRALVPGPYGDFFLCGLGSFMKLVYEDLAQWGVELERIHFEFFGPSNGILGGCRTSNHETHQIRFHPDTDPIAWDGASTLLDSALSHGVKPRYGCRSGVCGTCACKLLRGNVTYIQTPAAPPPKGTILICSACPDSDVILDLSPLEGLRAKGSSRTCESAPDPDFRPQS
jgi:ferredoxin